jgi:hypothetical protein
MTKNTFGYWEYSRYSELSILLPVTSADALALVYRSVNLFLNLCDQSRRGELTSNPVCVSDCLTIGPFWITSLPLDFSVIIPKEVDRGLCLCGST